ncbi:MAG: DinB family protein [Saprospiraceae bacterium]|nr:DinB family protein [Saprospiraceae bacterium]
MKIDLIHKTLADLSIHIQNLSDPEYAQAIQTLSGSSIGEHTRHIIEFFQELLSGYESGCVHYDGRKRNPLIQNNRQVAIDCIHQIASQIQLPDKTLQLKSCICSEDQLLATNYHRELFYAWEHCIHHQALIKVGLLELNKTTTDHPFGVAESTLSYRNQCAQ